MLIGRASREASSRYMLRFERLHQAAFYRSFRGIEFGSLAAGSYLGPMDDKTDRGYEETLAEAIQSGLNLIDTSLNYRHQRSERAVGQAILKVSATPPFDRNEFIVCSKAGYLVPGAVPDGLPPDQIAGGMHCMAPDFISDQLRRSRQNLGIETIDIYYLHNPETQLDSIAPDVFESRLRAAFERLEEHAAQGHIQFYGAATWSGFREPGRLSLNRMAGIAREVAGDAHRFRFIQLPVNLAMLEAVSRDTGEIQGRAASIIEVAGELGVQVIASASLLQSRLARGLPDEFAAAIPECTTTAQRALLTVRSVPGLLSALVGMSRVEHLHENLGAAEVLPIDPERFRRIVGLRS